MTAPGDAIRVLHVDDEPDFADLAATFLERADGGLRVDTATSAEDALERLDERYDCVVSDYDMPGRNGIELLEAVRDRHPELPFVLFTGKGSEEVASDAISAGATDYLQKESGSDQYDLLANRIRNAVASQRSERGQQRLAELAEHTDRVLYSFTADWDEVLFVSSAYEEVWGQPIGDLRADPMDFLDGVHPADRERVRDAMERAADGEALDTEFRVNPAEDYGRWVRASTELITDENGSVVRIVGSVADITDERSRRERRERQRETLVELATDEAVTTGDFETAVRRVTETAAAVLGVDRVNVWLVDDDRERLACVDHYDGRVDEHERGTELRTDDYPDYVDALRSHNVVDADDAREDPRTAELTDDYLDVHDVGALLDGTLRSEGEVVGVVCHEHVGGAREWTDDEIDFASDVADIVHRALRNRERVYREQELDLKTRAIEEAPIGITITGPESRDVPMVYVNEEFERLTGYDTEEILGRNCRFIQGEGTDPESVAELRRAIEAGEPTSVTLRNYRKDGTEFWNRVTIAPIRDVTGEVTHYVGFQQDVTDDREREQTLETLHTAAAEIQGCESVREACERTVEAAEGILDLELCSILLAEDGYLDPVAKSSEAPEDGVRRVPDDHGLAGKTYQTGEPTVVDEVEPDDETDPAKDTYQSGISVPVGGHGVFQAVALEPSAFDESDVRSVELLVAYTARAIDRIQFEEDLKEHSETLKRQNERLERFATIVSHDLRNPLNVAAGRLELARESCDSDHLDAVADAHDRMEALIDRLLTLAQDGGAVEDVQSVDLGSLARECWGNVVTPHATLVTETEGEVRADPDRLRQVLENLARNAVEHGGDGVTVTVGDLPGGFYVADDGPGIPVDERDAVFEYGYSNQSDGTGFGLAIVREIVEAHGWTIGVTDSAEGGARFEITGVERPS